MRPLRCTVSLGVSACRKQARRRGSDGPGKTRPTDCSLIHVGCEDRNNYDVSARESEEGGVMGHRVVSMDAASDPSFSPPRHRRGSKAALCPPDSCARRASNDFWQRTAGALDAGQQRQLGAAGPRAGGEAAASASGGVGCSASSADQAHVARMDPCRDVSAGTRSGDHPHRGGGWGCGESQLQRLRGEFAHPLRRVCALPPAELVSIREAHPATSGPCEYLLADRRFIHADHCHLSPDAQGNGSAQYRLGRGYRWNRPSNAVDDSPTMAIRSVLSAARLRRP